MYPAGKLKLEYGELCECIKSSEDKEYLLMILDDAVRKEEDEISHIQEHAKKAQVLMSKEDKSSDFYYAMKDSVQSSPRIVDLHEDYIIRIKVLRKKLADTKEC